MRDGIQQVDRAPRILFYSHDTFGLGHLRRSRAIAEALVSTFEGSSALILTGSPVAGRFTFPPGVDHIRMPGVVKTTEAEYVSESLNMDIEQTTALRASVILAAAVTFNPDLIIVDKEPGGFRGELTTTLEILKEMGRAKMVLGIRDILDSPEALCSGMGAQGRAGHRRASSTTSSGSMGTRASTTPCRASISRTTSRGGSTTPAICAASCRSETPATHPDRPYVLVTPGGGGDGEALVEWTLQRI